MTVNIHPTAEIHPTALIDSSVVIGAHTKVEAYSVISAGVTLGEYCHIRPHVVISGPTTIGDHNTFYSFCNIGDACQDKKYADEPTELTIGHRNVFREACTVHRGTVQDESLTSIGDDNLFMVNTHVAHDVRIANHCIFANDTNLAGHVHVGNWVILGGATQVHQFCRIHDHAMCSVGSVILKDIPSFLMVQGYPAKPFGINTEGLKRRGFDADRIKAIRNAYKVVYRKGLSLSEALDVLSADVANPDIEQFVSSIKLATRGIIR